MSQPRPSIHDDQLNKTPCKFPGSLNIPGVHVSEYLTEDRGKAVVSSLSSFLQERKVRAIQYEMESLNDPEMQEVAYQMQDAQKTTTEILQAILEILTEVQHRLYSVEKRTTTVEAEQSKTPPPKTSCGFSCSNNSVSIE